MDYKTALNKAATFCASSERSQKEVAEKLEKWGIAPNDANDILQHLIKEGFIDEVRYCKAFVQDKFKFNRWGKTKIAFMLKSKGIGQSSIDNALNTIDYDEYLTTLTELLEAKKKTLKKEDNPYQLKAKLYRFAISRGFENNCINECLTKMDKGQ